MSIPESEQAIAGELAGLRDEQRRLELRLNVVRARIEELRYYDEQSRIVTSWYDMEQAITKRFTGIWAPRPPREDEDDEEGSQ